MYAAGLDIGSTTCSAVVLDLENHRIAHTDTRRSRGLLPPDVPGGSLCDPRQLFETAEELLGDVEARFGKLCAVGLTGQMHGVVYLDADGGVLSPLYTWQDGRGNTPLESGESAARELSELTGYPMASGYGLTTHYVLARSGKAPEGAAYLATIADYTAMRLCGLSMPLMHVSNAAGLGAFDCLSGCFDVEALARANIDCSLLPPITRCAEPIGVTKAGAPVTVAVGDNQAGFLGAVDRPEDALLLNIGTSGQVSAVCESPKRADLSRLRPLTDEHCLLVGATLCGGRAYAALERFFRSCLRLAGAPEADDLYPLMNTAALCVFEDGLRIRTTFAGTRENPALRGSVENLGVENFTAEQLTRGVLEGIVDELYGQYLAMLPALGPKTRLVGGGNALRHNPALRRIAEERFGMRLEIPIHREEAAVGAALFGAAGAGWRVEPEKFISYRISCQNLV